jgi:hypothetical protein
MHKSELKQFPHLIWQSGKKNKKINILNYYYLIDYR